MERTRTSLTAALAALVVLFAVPAALVAQPSIGRQILTIDDAVRLALERNISIALASSRVDNAGARVTTSFGTFLPQFAINASYNRPLTESTVYYQGIAVPGTRPDVLQANASASVELFDGFSRTATYSGAQSNFNASVEDLNRERQTVTWQTRSAFLNALRAEQLIVVRESDLEVARENLARIRGLVEAGVAQAGQIYSEESSIANAELALEQSRTDAVVARQQLAFLLNVDPRSELQLSDEGLATNLDSTEIAAARASLGTTASLTEQAIARRADILAARLRVEAADAQITVARASYFPSVGAGVNYSWQSTGGQSTGGVSVGRETSSDASFGLNLQYLLFDGFRTSEQVQIAQAQRQTAELDVRRLELQAQADVQTALAQVEGAERQLRAADRAVAAARQNRFAADERYRAGVGTYTDFLLANAQFLSAQINQVNAVYNFRLAIFQVRYHLGE